MEASTAESVWVFNVCNVAGIAQLLWHFQKCDDVAVNKEWLS
jgi:hypothetical protein